MRIEGYKNKCITVGIATIVGFYIAYIFAFSATYDLWKSYTKAEQNAQNAIQVEENLIYFKAKLENIKNSNSRVNNLGNFENQLLSFLLPEIEKKKGVLIKSIPSKHQIEEGEFKLETLEVELSGHFEALVTLLSITEKQFTNGKIISGKFYTTEDPRTKESTLKLKLYVQKIIEK